MSQQVKVYRDLEFFQGGARKVRFDIDKTTNKLLILPEASDTQSIEIGDGTTDADVKIFLGSSSEYALFDVGNSRLDLSTIDVELPSACVDTADIANDQIDSQHYAADSIDKEHLASEIYAIEPVCFSGVAVASTTYKIYQCWSAGTVVRVIYFTHQAIGTSEGIDVIDGGTDGSGTTVIDACSDNLNGVDVNTLTTPYALSAGDYINIKTDALVASSFISVIVLLKVPLGAAT